MLQIYSKIALQTIRDLKCRHCSKFLTCGPIHVTPDGGNLCGRCRNISKPTFRNFAYESAASLYLFPCHNWSKHCAAVLNWNESLEHERRCVHNSKFRLACSKPSLLFRKERKIPEFGEINYDHIPDAVQEFLKCYLCSQNINSDPVHLTSEGKNICHRCVTSSGLPPSTVRNMAYERIAANLIFPCSYRPRGCPARFRFGREMLVHETDCPYGPPTALIKSNKKPNKYAKERGVIETHSGHYWGTITPHSAAFAPPTKNQDGKILTNELEQHLRMKYPEEGDETIGLSRQSSDSRLSSRPPTRESFNEDITDVILPRPQIKMRNEEQSNNGDIIFPSPAPAGYQRTQNYSAYYDEGEMYAQSPNKSPNLGNFTFSPSPSPKEVQRSSSLRVGNADIINELKYRHSKKPKIDEDTASNE